MGFGAVWDSEWCEDWRGAGFGVMWGLVLGLEQCWVWSSVGFTGGIPAQTRTWFLLVEQLGRGVPRWERKEQNGRRVALPELCGCVRDVVMQLVAGAMLRAAGGSGRMSSTGGSGSHTEYLLLP